MVVGFVLEQKQPVFFLTLYGCLDFHGAGVYFFRLIKAIHLALSLQSLGRNGSYVHKGDRLGSSQALSDFQIFLVGLPDSLVLEGHVIDYRVKCCMSAVIRPVCVDHLYFRNCRNSSFFPEVFLAHADVIVVHGKTHLAYESSEGSLIHVIKALNGGNLLRNIINCLESLRHFQRCFPHFNRIDYMTLDCTHVLRAQGSFKEINLGALNNRSVLL